MIPTCSNCRYFVPDEPEIIDTLTHDDGSIEEIINDEEIDSGTCHRHAPQPTMYCFLPTSRPIRDLETDKDYFEDPDTTAIWPAVDAEDYCGEFKMIDRKGKK